MRVQRKYTVKEWKKLYKLQELLCKKYDVVLVDYTTNREKLGTILKEINLKNINRGIETFNKIIQDFGGSMEKLTTELDKTSQNNIKIWSDTPKKKSPSKSRKSKDQINLEKIWGNKFEM